MNILLIEDDKESANYIAKGLRESGHVVDYVTDGDKGLEMALAGQFDVLVVDRMLP
ncbi:MAG: DNA-binding response regulator, partial [Alphaproteobacteria bacterium]|nr:DNA-binding response regulator [Alphaproteobacteria bacterium]